MTDIEMLPIPTEWVGVQLIPNSFIEAYARAVAEHNVKRERERAERLAEALRWYANPEIYKPHPHGPAFDIRDLSFAAIAALRDHDQEETHDR